MERYKNEIIVREECNAEFRKQEIIELVEKIDNLEILLKILSFIQAWMEE